MSSDFFTVHDNETQADLLARKLPDGLALNAKYQDGSVLRRVLLALGAEYARMEAYLNYVKCELNLSTTNDLILEHEADYRMSGNCFKDQDALDIQQRIKNILTLISARGTTTAEQFEIVADAMGFNISVESKQVGSENNFPFTFPMTFTVPYDWRVRFQIFIDVQADTPSSFPYTFPITFAEDTTAILVCFLETLKPSNTEIVWEFSGA